MTANGVVPQAPQPGVPIHQASNPYAGGFLPGVSVTQDLDNQAPIILVSAREKDGKSTTAITSCVGWPTQELHPLVLAIDDTGPDACLNLGYRPLKMRFRDEDYPGVPFHQRVKMALGTLEARKAQLKLQHGAIIIDDASTLANRLHEDAKREPKNARNPDMRAPFFELGVWFKEIINRVADLGLPSIWLSWLTEGNIEKTKDAQGRDQVRMEMGGADILGRKLRNFLAGRAHQMFVLEKRKIGVGSKDYDTGQPADALGYSRVLHARPWNNINAGGRYDRLLPPICPPHVGWILSQICGRGPFAAQGQAPK